MHAEPLPGGSTNAGAVVRIGDTIRRPRGDGHEIVEALLLHLADVGFDRAPRLRGIDDQGRQVLEYIEGLAVGNPAWQLDDDENARRLGEIAAVLRDLHIATASFEPPPGMTPRRPLPVAGTTWTHGDVNYSNTVYDRGRFVALIDWEFAAPAGHLHGPAGLLATEIRGPRPDVDDNDRRGPATRLALAAIAVGFDIGSDEVAELPEVAAVILDDAADYWTELERPPDVVARTRWRADWFRSNAEWLVS